MEIDADYLVVGAGAMGMAFTDALVDHSDKTVTIVDRRTAPGGHWRDAYPFVRLHQASTFYGVASTPFGGRVQTSGPETGLHERATGAEICEYHDAALARLEATGRVRTRLGTELGPDLDLAPHTRVVDATYLAPTIPATTPPPFEVGDGARVIPVNDVPTLDGSARQYVVVGSGKTATDAIIWLLGQGLDPGRICWVRPRDPWMANRAKIQPDPAVFLGMVADVMTAADGAASLDELFLRLEEADVMFRLDRSVTPTMAKAPTLATWELDLLRTVEHVVRRGHVRRVDPGRLTMTDGVVDLDPDAVVVHCAASGLQNPSLVPIWQDDVIRLQVIRASFPCFCAALAGYVEATRTDPAARNDAEKNRLCPPTPYGNTLREWAEMNLRGTRATQAFNSEPDIKDWANGVLLNPARIPPERAGDADVTAAQHRLADAVPAGLVALQRLAESGRP
jgi:hypothetical protein